MPIGANPYSNDGIKGFKPTQPFNSVSIHLASSADDSIHFPSLSELNAEMFEWYSGEEEALAVTKSLCIELDVFAINASAEPTPQPIPTPTAAPLAPVLPTLSDLTVKLLASADKLFFIAHMIPGSSVSEWHLVQVDLSATMREHPTALQDGRLLVNFYTCHPSDRYFHAFNQRY